MVYNCYFEKVQKKRNADFHFVNVPKVSANTYKF